MIELDVLAENRAAKVNEDPEPWRKAIWSEIFLKLSQSMTDGEIEQMLNICPSSRHFELVLNYLAAEIGTEHPLKWIEAAAASKRLELTDWVRSLPKK